MLSDKFAVIVTKSHELMPPAFIDFLNTSYFSYENEAINIEDLKEKFMMDFCLYLEEWTSIFERPLYVSDLAIIPINKPHSIERKNEVIILNENQKKAIATNRRYMEMFTD